jgi:hypothetical protein
MLGVQSEGIVALDHPVTADVSADKLVVGFAEAVSLSLQLSARESNYLRELVTNEGGQVDVNDEYSVVT